jgi:hypothetical protein
MGFHAIPPERIPTGSNRSSRFLRRNHSWEQTHQSRRPAMSQIDDSMLRLAQRAAYKPRKTGTLAHLHVLRSNGKKASQQQFPEKHNHSPKRNIPPRKKESKYPTYPTNSPSSAATVSPHPHPLPSLSPSPSHSYCCRRQKTKASTGGGTKRSSSPALTRSCGGGMMGSRRKPMMLKKTFGGSRRRIACWGCGLRVWGWRMSFFCFVLCSGLVCVGTGMVRVATARLRCCSFRVL